MEDIQFIKHLTKNAMFSYPQFACSIVRSFKIVFVNQLAIFPREFLARYNALL